MAEQQPITKVRADFNGVFGEVLCLSHQDTGEDDAGNPVVLREGMRAMAFDADVTAELDRDDLIATGTVARPPKWLNHSGARWVLVIDSNGIRRESDVALR